MKVGDYVRTEGGCIGKIILIINNDYFNIKVDYGDFTEYEHKEDLIKSSSNSIIDLIEVGDYVNGCPVLFKEENVLRCGLILNYYEKDIKTIVTKEQFESMEYRIGD